MGHVKSQACGINCSDPRMQRPFVEWMEAQYGPSDTITVVGGPSSLLNDVSRDYVLHLIEQLHGLHGFTTIVLMAHMNCGAYNADERFKGDADAERAIYEADLEAEAQIIREHFPHHTVVKAIGAVDGSGTITIVS